MGLRIAFRSGNRTLSITWSGTLRSAQKFTYRVMARRAEAVSAIIIEEETGSVVATATKLQTIDGDRPE